RRFFEGSRSALADIDLAQYDAMVLDTQGSELLILQSAATILGGFNFIQVEAANFEAYRNCATVDTVNTFLRGYGFRPLDKRLQARREGGGEYFDLLFVIPRLHRLLRRISKSRHGCFAVAGNSSGETHGDCTTPRS